LAVREAGVLAVTVLSGETVRPSTPHISSRCAVWEQSAHVRVLVCVSVSFSWPYVARGVML
jgi:hypothetical protein